MKTYLADFAQLAPSLEAVAVADVASLESVTNDVMTLEQQGRELNREIALECERVATLESLITTLHDTETTLTPFQVSMLQHAARNVAVPLAHQQLGFGLESYQGLRGRQMLTISTEGFVEALKKALAKILALFERLKAWVKNLLSNRSKEAQWVIAELKKPQGKHALGSPKALEIAKALSIQGKLDIHGVISNTKQVLEGVTNPAYPQAVGSYGSRVKQVLLQLTADSQNWRTAAKEVSTLSLPVPQNGFEQEKSMGQVAEYRSLYLADSAAIVITSTPTAAGGGSAGANDGVRGAEARATALSTAGTVRVVGGHEFTGEALTDLKQFGNANVATAAHGLVDVMNQVVAAGRSTNFLFSHLDQQAGDLTTIVESIKQLEPRILTMASHLIVSIGKASSSATSVLGAITGRALRAGRAVAVLQHYDLNANPAQ